nr:MAG TPA: hypothetical protein [Caudoviricetes sp.]
MEQKAENPCISTKILFHNRSPLFHKRSTRKYI